MAVVSCVPSAREKTHAVSPVASVRTRIHTWDYSEMVVCALDDMDLLELGYFNFGDFNNIDSDLCFLILP